MKLKNILSLLFIGLLLIGASSSGNFVPEDGFVTSILYTDVDFEDRNNVLLGETISFDIVVKNLTNNSISNLTITQQIPETLDLQTVMGQTIAEGPVTLTDLSVASTIGSKTLSVRYLNVTNSNFTTNLDITMAAGESIGLQFEMQANELTVTAGFSAPSVTYYDHWGDRYNARRQSLSQFNLEVTTTTTPPYLSFIPDFDTTENDYNLIIGLALAVSVVALLGRVLYLKKPIEL